MGQRVINLIRFGKAYLWQTIVLLPVGIHIWGMEAEGRLFEGGGTAKPRGLRQGSEGRSPPAYAALVYESVTFHFPALEHFGTFCAGGNKVHQPKMST